MGLLGQDVDSARSCFRRLVGVCKERDGQVALCENEQLITVTVDVGTGNVVNQDR